MVQIIDNHLYLAVHWLKGQLFIPVTNCTLKKSTQSKETWIKYLIHWRTVSATMPKPSQSFLIFQKHQVIVWIPIPTLSQRTKTFQIQLRVSGQAAELIYMHISVSMENSFGFEPAIPYKGAKINIHWLLISNSSTEKNGY